MNNKIIIICEFINNGNTWKLAQRLAQILGSQFQNVNQTLTEDLSQYNTIEFGSGIYLL